MGKIKSFSLYHRISYWFVQTGKLVSKAISLMGKNFLAF